MRSSVKKLWSCVWSHRLVFCGEQRSEMLILMQWSVHPLSVYEELTCATVVPCFYVFRKKSIPVFCVWVSKAEGEVLIANRKHKHSVPADWTSDQVGGEWKKQIQQREADVSKTHQRRRLISHLVNEWNTQHHGRRRSFAFGVSPRLLAPHHYPYFCYALPFADKRVIKHRLRPIKVKQCYKILKLCISKRRMATLSSRQKQIQNLIALSFALSGNHDADKSIGKRKRSLAARGTAAVCGRAAASFAKARV